MLLHKLCECIRKVGHSVSDVASIQAGLKVSGGEGHVLKLNVVLLLSCLWVNNYFWVAFELWGDISDFDCSVSDILDEPRVRCDIVVESKSQIDVFELKLNLRL